jgi:hypothetical protein
MFVGTAVGRPATPSVKLERSGLTGRVSRAASSSSLCIFACLFLQHNEQTHVSVIGCNASHRHSTKLRVNNLKRATTKLRHSLATFSYHTPQEKLLHTSRFHCFQIRLAAMRFLLLISTVKHLGDICVSLIRS